MEIMQFMKVGSIIVILTAIFLTFLTDLPAEEAVSNKEIIIWREAENITADWGLAQGRPASHRDDPNWFSGKGGVRTQLPEAFTWQFRIKEEVRQDTLKPLERKYRVWVRIYYYARTKLSAQFDGKKIGEFDAAMDTEKVYFRSGTFYWAPLGDFLAVGGTHSLTFKCEVPAAWIDAILVTTDPDYRPDTLEAREKADEDFFTDLHGHEVHSVYRFNGVTDQLTTLLTFKVHPLNGRSFYPAEDERIVFHLLLPEEIEVRNISSHFAGTRWHHSNAKRPFRWSKTGVQVRDGRSMGHYETDLSYIGLHVVVCIQAREAGFETGKRLDGEYWLETVDMKQSPKNLQIETVHIPKAESFSKIFIGPCGGNAPMITIDYPGVFDTLKHSGFNLYSPGWFDTWYEKHPELFAGFIGECEDRGILFSGAHSPFFGTFGPDGTDENDFAVNINGERTEKPSLIVSDATLKKNTDRIRNIMSIGLRGAILNDENYNQRIDHIDYNDRVKETFRKYLAEQTNLTYQDPVQIVENKEQNEELYNAWVDFKCRCILDRYEQYIQAFEESREAAGTKGETIFIAQILKNKTAYESKTNTYWDYKLLANYCTHISPMIYTYGGLKYVPEVGDVIAMYHDYIGKNIITPTLLIGHDDFGEVFPENKPMIKYEIMEALIHKSPGILYWVSPAVFNAINLVHVAEGIRLTQPYEEIFLEGESYTDLKVAPDWVRVRALKYGNKVLVYVANYDKEPETEASVSLEEVKVTEVFDIAANKPLEVKSNGFSTNFKDDLGKLFLLTVSE